MDLICVDTADKEIGLVEKMEAHQKGILHRAFSVYIFSPDKQQILLQQRAETKYHCANMRANTCCSHPYPGESTEKAAYRRLYEEMGIAHVELTHCTEFVYHTEVPPNLIEHEYLHVFIGTTKQDPLHNPDEVQDRKRVSIHDFVKVYIPNHEILVPRTRITWERCQSLFLPPEK